MKQLNSLRKNLKEIESLIEKENEPNLQNFFKFCEQYYGRPVLIGEMLFKYYRIDNELVKSNTPLFCALSVKYFENLHNVPNPIKDSWDYSLKHWLSVRWRDKNKPNLLLQEAMEDEDYCRWFEEYWQNLIDGVDLETMEAK